MLDGLIKLLVKQLKVSKLCRVRSTNIEFFPRICLVGYKNKMVYTLQEPIGVCGQIIPWNYPVRVISRRLSSRSILLIPRFW